MPAAESYVVEYRTWHEAADDVVAIQRVHNLVGYANSTKHALRICQQLDAEGQSNQFQ